MNQYKRTLKKIREKLPPPELDLAERIARFVHRKEVDRFERGRGPEPTSFDETLVRVRAFVNQKERERRDG